VRFRFVQCEIPLKIEIIYMTEARTTTDILTENLTQNKNHRTAR